MFSRDQDARVVSGTVDVAAADASATTARPLNGAEKLANSIHKGGNRLDRRHYNPACDGRAVLGVVDLLVDAEPSVGGTVARGQDREPDGIVDLVRGLDRASHP